MVKDINGDIYSDLITSARAEVYGSNGYVGLEAKRFIVIHGTASTNIETIWSMWWSNVNPNGREASANYVCNDTQIVGCIGEQFSAWHCGGVGSITNQNSIGIEHVNSSIGNINDASTYLFNEATLRNGARLCADICHRHGIVPSASTIVPHREVYATACPQTLNMDHYIDMVIAFYNGSDPSTAVTPQPSPTPKPSPSTAIGAFKAANNAYYVSASFNVSAVEEQHGIWQLLSSDLLGGSLDGADWELNGVPLDCITFVNNDGSACSNQSWDGTQPRFVFNGDYNHGTIDLYDDATNAVGIDFGGGYGTIWFNAVAWLNG